MKKISIVMTGLLLASLATLPALAEEPAAPPAKAAAEADKTAQPAGAAPAVPSKAEKVVRIGFVDMPTIAKDSAPGKAAYAEIKAKTEKFQKQIRAKEKQLQKQKAAIEAQIPTLSPPQREAKAKEFQKKIEAFQKFVQNADKEVRAKEEELLGKLFKSVDQVAGEYAKANGFTAVVMKNQLLFVAPEAQTTDLTPEMIKLVDKTMEKK